MDCVICGRVVHPERIKASPNVRTCSKECSGLHQANIRNDAAVRRRLRVKAAKERLEAEEKAAAVLG